MKIKNVNKLKGSDIFVNENLPAKLPAKLESLSVGPFFVIDSLNHNSQDPDVSFSHGNVSLLETNYILRRDFNGNFHSLFNNIISEV